MLILSQSGLIWIASCSFTSPRHGVSPSYHPWNLLFLQHAVGFLPSKSPLSHVLLMSPSSPLLQHGVGATHVEFFPRRFGGNNCCTPTVPPTLCFAKGTVSPQLVSGGCWVLVLTWGRSDCGITDSRSVNAPIAVTSVTTGPLDGRWRSFCICWIHFAAPKVAKN